MCEVYFLSWFFFLMMGLGVNEGFAEEVVLGAWISSLELQWKFRGGGGGRINGLFARLTQIQRCCGIQGHRPVGGGALVALKCSGVALR